MEKREEGLGRTKVYSKTGLAADAEPRPRWCKGPLAATPMW